MKKQKPPKDMAKELEKYKNSVYMLNKIGGLMKINIETLNDYNHSKCMLHHYIPYSLYAGNEKWYEERGIKQKLILVSIVCHEHIHNNGIEVLTDAQFEKRYKIQRSKLIFSRKGDY